MPTFYQPFSEILFENDRMKTMKRKPILPIYSFYEGFFEPEIDSIPSDSVQDLPENLFGSAEYPCVDPSILDEVSSLFPVTPASISYNGEGFSLEYGNRSWPILNPELRQMIGEKSVPVEKIYQNGVFLAEPALKANHFPEELPGGIPEAAGKISAHLARYKMTIKDAVSGLLPFASLNEDLRKEIRSLFLFPNWNVLLFPVMEGWLMAKVNRIQEKIRFYLQKEARMECDSRHHDGKHYEGICCKVPPGIQAHRVRVIFPRWQKKSAQSILLDSEGRSLRHRIRLLTPPAHLQESCTASHFHLYEIEADSLFQDSFFLGFNRAPGRIRTEPEQTVQSNCARKRACQKQNGIATAFYSTRNINCRQDLPPERQRKTDVKLHQIHVQKYKTEKKFRNLNINTLRFYTMTPFFEQQRSLLPVVSSYHQLSWKEISDRISFLGKWLHLRNRCFSCLHLSGMNHLPEIEGRF